MNRILNIQGGGYTGATAVLHWLSGFFNVKLIPCELDIYRAPGGLLDLYFAFRKSYLYKEYRLYDGIGYLYGYKGKKIMKPMLLRYFHKSDYIKLQISKYDTLVTLLSDTLISSSWEIYPAEVKLNFIDKFKEYSIYFKKKFIRKLSPFFSVDFEEFYRNCIYI